MLIATAAVAGWPLALKVLAFIAAVVHAVLLRPRRPPRRIVVTGDGSFVVPEWFTAPRPPGARTFVCPFWIRLDLGGSPGQRDILLLCDQVPPAAWRRMRALLARMRCE